MSGLKICGCVLAATLLLAGPATAQDSHYWTYQYGTRSNLLGGAVIGSVLDLSGTFYNPGGLSLIKADAVELLMFAKVFHYPNIRLTGFGLEQRSLNSTELGEAPSLIAGSIPLKGLGKHWLGYSYLKRSYSNLEIVANSENYSDFQGLFPVGIPAAVNGETYEILNEPWYGITWAYRLSAHVGVGISQYVTYRNHWISRQTIIQALPNDEKVRMLMGKRDFKYQHYGLLWKIGAAFDFDRITLGFTLTTPRIHLYSTARSGLNATSVRQNPEKPDFMAANSQDKLRAGYKTPLSLGFGLTYKLGSTNLYASGEWFGGIDEYAVIKGEDFTGQSTGETLPNEVLHMVEPVMNVALGAEHHLSRNFTLYASFWTDFSCYDPGTRGSLSIMDWDIYHFMGGTTLSFKKSQLTLGMGYAYGNRDVIIEEGLLPGADPVVEIVTGALFEGMEYLYSSFVWVIGYSF
jgi:hypothetical protein